MALRKELLMFPFPFFWGLIITEDNIGIALGSYTCADDGFTLYNTLLWASRAF